jgi:tRNA-dihydrouridine synthase A
LDLFADPILRFFPIFATNAFPHAMTSCRSISRAQPHPLSVAPMMDRTDRHFRYFLRRISRRTLLYTEMVTTAAIEHGNVERLLGFDPEERPLSLQLGGDDPVALARCARLAADLGYDEVNLNVGCPSDRVQRGRFGACLMAEPGRVADGVAAMRAAVALPITVKHRIGIDELDRYEDMLRFVDTLAEAGCDRFSVHARKAWLQGLSPKENREIPPLRYPEVHQLKRERPGLLIELNGGVRTLDAAAEHLGHVDGVMIGRAAYDDPYLLAGADRKFYDEGAAIPSRREILEGLLPYLERKMAERESLARTLRHASGLFTGARGARLWRRFLSEGSYANDLNLLAAVLRQIPAEVLDQRGETSETSTPARAPENPAISRQVAG